MLLEVVGYVDCCAILEILEAGYRTQRAGDDRWYREGRKVVLTPSSGPTSPPLFAPKLRGATLAPHFAPKGFAPKNQGSKPPVS